MIVFRILAIAFCILTSISAKAQSPQDAPLGLTWGSSVSEIRARGIELNDFPDTNYGNSFLAAKLDKAVADQDRTFLSFGFDDRLWRVVIVSRPFANDPYGTAVLARYKELSNVLEEKYGKPVREYHHLGGLIYSEPQYFVAGIASGESKWYSTFETSSLRIQLFLRADDPSSLRWQILYEDKLLQKAFEQAKRTKEKGSL